MGHTFSQDLLTCLKCKVTEKDVPFTGELSKWPQQPGVEQAELGSQDLHLSLPHRWQESKYSAVSCCLSGALAGTWVRSREPELEPALCYSLLVLQAEA